MRALGGDEPQQFDTKEQLLLAALTRLAVRMGQRTADEAVAVLRYHLGRVFPAG
ncbi:hypothetical protein [Kitasatospora sp. LaBMicrA B282]|uniref:hypothetical protein n=1 Tax=Kitasatospora sp. LaBMicrA B282 TaxID=3420949 RepID=UPI003D10ECBB